MQHNRIDRKVKSADKYRSETFKEIINIKKSKLEINDIILASNINQDIAMDKVQQFFAQLGM